MSVLRRHVAIPLANGLTTGSQGLVSLYYAPRLPTGGALGTKAEWANWASSVGALTVEFRTNNGVVPAAQVTKLSTTSSTVWSALFDPALTVAPWTGNDRRNTTVRSFGERALADDVIGLYRDIALNSPLAPLSAADLLARPMTSAILTGGGGLGADLAAARNYQRRVGAVPGAADAEPSWEFHQAISLLGRHPHLMRLLGIVVDYSIPMHPTNPTSWVQAVSDYETVYDPVPVADTVEEISPRVMVTSAFRVAALHTDMGNGFLGLSDEDTFGLSELDVTSAVTKLVALAREVESPASSGALPALNDSGLSLLRTARPTALNQQFLDDYQLEQAIQGAYGDPDAVVNVYAEHVRVGYRVDVIKDGAAPLSLFERKTDEYHFPRNQAADTVPPADEGWVGTSMNLDRVTSGSPTQRLPEALARWRGWSLAAKPRGNVADPKTGDATTTSNTARGTDPVQLEVDYEVVPGTLPSLRYGATYQMRARMVDIAGNSVPLGTATPVQAPTEEHVYGRLEPLPAPVVVRRDPRSVPGLGDTTARVVIRSNYDTPYASIPTAQRLVFPPSASQQTCERHGVPGGGASGTPATYTLLAERDGLDYSEHCLPDPVSEEPYAQGAASHDAAYLPDPAGPTLCLMGLPGTTGDVPVLADFAGSWPGWSTRRLVVQGAADGAPTVAGGGGPVTVFLPKAAQHEIDLSVAPGNAYDDHFALWQEILAANPNDLATLRSIVREGRHWMISSRTRIRIVHAVRQPLSIPGFNSLSADRPEVGSRTFTLTGIAALNRASTGRTILTGRWTDPVDDVTEPGPSETSGLVVVGTQKVRLDGPPNAAGVQLSHDFLDARRHDLLVRQEAFTRFARDFTEQASVVVPASAPVTLDARGVLAASVVVRSADGATTYTAGADYLLDPAAGTVTRVAGGAIAGGATVLAQYVALPLSRMSDESGAADVTVTIPNAKVPNALSVASVVPSFIRRTTTKKKSITIRHDAQVLRCYLDRPWYDTGVGEQLGVVLEPTSGAPVPPAPPANTRWARDSLLRRGALPRPAAGHFPRGTHRVADGLHIVGHAVAYDSTLQQWYSDVQIDAPLGYRAFVQLALARYQPESITGAAVSRISVTDAVLVGPSRLVKVKRSRTKVKITVAGAEHEGHRVDGKRRHNEVTISVQGIDKDVRDRELRWTERPLGEKELRARRRQRPGRALVTWTKSIKLEKLALGKPIRLVITESEPMATAKPKGAREELVYVPVHTEVVDLPRKWTKRREASAAS